MKKKCFLSSIYVLFLLFICISLFLACIDETPSNEESKNGRYIVEKIEYVYFDNSIDIKMVNDMTPAEREKAKDIIDMVFLIQDDQIDHIVYGENNPKKFIMNGNNIIVLEDDGEQLNGQVPIIYEDKKIILVYSYEHLEHKPYVMNIVFRKE